MIINKGVKKVYIMSRYGLKKTLLVVILTLTSLSSKWDGLYMRGSASVEGGSALRSFGGMVPLKLAAGYGVTLPGYLTQGLYVGGDAELINFTVNFGSVSGSSQFAPKLLARFGWPQTQYMSYIAPSLGYYSGSEGVFTWGLRMGIDFDFISAGFFWGINLDWSRTINAKSDNFSILTSGFTFGYRF